MSYSRKSVPLPTHTNDVLRSRSSAAGGLFGPGGRLLVGKREPQPAPQVKASKNARELARKRGVNLAAVTGTGVDGAITVEDVRRLNGGI